MFNGIRGDVVNRIVLSRLDSEADSLEFHDLSTRFCDKLNGLAKIYSTLLATMPLYGLMTSMGIPGYYLFTGRVFHWSDIIWAIIWTLAQMAAQCPGWGRGLSYIMLNHIISLVLHHRMRLSRWQLRKNQPDDRLTMDMSIILSLNDKVMAPLNLILCSCFGAAIIHAALTILLGEHGLAVRALFTAFIIFMLFIVNLSFISSQILINDGRRLANQLYSMNCELIGSKLPRDTVARKLLTRQSIIESFSNNHMGFWAGRIVPLTRQRQLEVSRQAPFGHFYT